MMSYEGANLGIKWSDLYSDPYPIGAALAWMFADFFIYWLMAWYLEQTLPNDVSGSLLSLLCAVG
jgi:hypothetical protein